jgi:outer membrane protein assembly factor BamB
VVNRRAFLAAVGTLAGSGCATRRGGESRTGEPATVSTTATAEATTEATGGTTMTASSDGGAVPDSVDTAWPMPAHDSGLSNYTAEATGPTTPPTELWSVSFETSLSDLAVADGTVYVGGEDGAVRALDARTGTEQWREVVGPAATTPRVVDGRLYVPTPGAVVVLEADGGSSVERVETPGRSDLLVASHGVYSVDVDGPALVAHGHDGDRRWRADLGTPWQSPLFASDDHVFVSTGTHWEEPWTFAVDTGRFAGDRRPDGRGNDMIAERFALDGTVFAVDPMFGEVEAAVLDDGGYDRRWYARLDAYSPVTLAGGADHLYVAAEHPEPGLYALSLIDGTAEWQVPLPGDLAGRPVVARETVLVQAGGELHCFDPEDGSRRWSRAADDLGPRVAVVDDLVYTVHGGTVRALRGA